MAEEKTEKIVTLSPERRKELAKSLSDMSKIKATLVVLEKTGLDTTPLRERLQWAEEVSELLLSEF